MVSRRTEKVAGVGILLVFLTALVSGVSNIVNAIAMKGTNPDAFVTLRNVLVALLLVPMVFLVRRENRTRIRRVDWARLAAIGLVGGAIPFVLFFRGIQMATAAGGAVTASFGYRTLFLMATVLAVVYLRERVSWRILLAASLLLIGNALLLSLTAPVWTDGTVLVLLATSLWAGEYTLSKRTLRDVPSGTVALGRMGFGSAFLLAYLGISGQFGSLAGFTGPQIQWMALSAILLVGFVSTWYAGLRHVDLSVASAVLVLGFPIGWGLNLAMGAAFDVAQAAGVVAIVFGVALAVGLVALRDSWRTVIRLVRARLRIEASR